MNLATLYYIGFALVLEMSLCYIILHVIIALLNHYSLPPIYGKIYFAVHLLANKVVRKYLLLSLSPHYFGLTGFMALICIVNRDVGIRAFMFDFLLFMFGLISRVSYPVHPPCLL